MTWWRSPSRHPDPKTKAVQQQWHAVAVSALEATCERRDPEQIARLFARDVELAVDSGGLVPTPADRVEGDRAAADLLLGILAQYSPLTLDVGAVNGAPGILLREGGILVAVISVATTREAISRIWVVVNPDKLVRFDVA
ncbi:hypothetical protein NQ152_09725 [Microbacterium sp. zg.B48]|uniref:hypothetical protein n=1 Tax=Microbacterium sp. zg.B48 TaxID=2969408 RepID=UPI00214CC628|nr:hypothetical protein [Microbacterium sp. zg.B48]MCR2763785.1 hypothetical protein [Microbacterium sp. zg.B48]